MLNKKLVVQNKTGLHARPASEFVKKASTFKSSVYIQFGEKNINAKSIVGLLSAGIGYGSELTLIVDGEDEKEAIEVLSLLIEEKFD